MYDAAELWDTIVHILEREFQVSQPERSERLDAAGMSSMDVLELIYMLEDSHGVAIESSDLERLRTYDDLVFLLVQAQ